MCTYVVFKVVQAEFVGLFEELAFVHASNVQDEVCPFGHPVAVDVVIVQSSSHDEIHHRMKPQRFFDETLENVQVL